MSTAARSATAPSALALDPERAGLLIVDIQERLAAAMPAEVLAQVERNVGILCALAGRFAMPVVLSEQYPKGLGKTTPGVERAVAELGELAVRFEKLDFGVCEAAEFAPIWDRLGREQWVVTGMETHVCVYQSVRQLASRGAAVHVPRDAVVSRSKANWRVGIGLIGRSGGIVTSTEVLVFDALKRAGTEDFKVLAGLVR
jgi:nicotinamidase-related amidase